MLSHNAVKDVGIVGVGVCDGLLEFWIMWSSGMVWYGIMDRGGNSLDNSSLRW